MATATATGTITASKQSESPTSYQAAAGATSAAFFIAACLEHPLQWAGFGPPMSLGTEIGAPRQHRAAPAGPESKSEGTALEYQALRERLEAEHRRLESEIVALRDVETNLRADSAAPESGGVGNHLADEGTQTFDVERSFAMEANLESLLIEVQHALRKYEQGTYGICDDCGQPIAYERLEALPHASLCITCKAQREKAGVRPPPTVGRA